MKTDCWPVTHLHYWRTEKPQQEDTQEKALTQAFKRSGVNYSRSFVKRTRRSFCFFPRRMVCVGWVVMVQQSHQSAHDNTKWTAWQKLHQPRISTLRDILWCASVYVHVVCPAVPIAFSLDENTGDTFSSAIQVCFWAHTKSSSSSWFSIRDNVNRIFISRHYVNTASVQPVICQYPCVLWHILAKALWNSTSSQLYPHKITYVIPSLEKLLFFLKINFHKHYCNLWSNISKDKHLCLL